MSDLMSFLKHVWDNNPGIIILTVVALLLLASGLDGDERWNPYD